VTLETVQSKPLTPALFGVGSVEARYVYRIGPTLAGRLQRLDVQVGDRVAAGQLLGEMDPVDLDDRIRSQEAALKRAKAMLHEAEARQDYAQTQARRYAQLFETHATSEDSLTQKRQELRIADATLIAAREDLARARADREALVAQRSNLRLTAPVDGLVTAREIDPGSTVVAGQTVVELIDPGSLWIDARFDQVSTAGLAAGLPAQIVLRSRNHQALPGQVLRLEPKADPITEETLAKVTFAVQPEPLPPLGEIAEVTVNLPTLPAKPLISNAAIQRKDSEVGVWRYVDGDLRFTPVQLGNADLDGQVQIKSGLDQGSQVVVYSAQTLTPRSRIQVVAKIPGAPQ
jgi:RND family efflux transporter MFP subunit